MTKVFIGVGHGGSDPGAVGKVEEAAANLTIALKVRSELMRHGVTVKTSRLADVDNPLTTRIAQANAGAFDLAIDIHNNAGGGDGFEAYIQTGKHAAKSKACAAAVEKQVVAIGQKSRGLKTRLNASGKDYFGFLRQVNCPAVLFEGFFVDSSDALGFDTISEQQALGVAYAKGILAFLGIPYKPENKYFDAVKDRFGFSDDTMEYLTKYAHAQAMLQRLAEAK